MDGYESLYRMYVCACIVCVYTNVYPTYLLHMND